jgi:hypothetical protein
MRLILLPFLLLLSGCCFVPPSDGNGYQPPGGSGRVVINDHVLSDSEIRAFRNYYGVEPQPGNYWYDPESGLYGRIGYGAAGFINPGHQFGTLDPEASGGNTGTYLNGRELTYEELYYIESYYGMDLGQGDYYLDDQGYFGGDDYYVNTFDYYDYGSAYGDPSLYYGGGTDVYGDSGIYYGQISNDWGGGGDNFWSTNYAAGNSEGGCTYVNAGGEFATSGCG